ncbi:MAG TPA: biotin/lipoyl-binding protein [Firmicutes bacterium]|nr:biotin/lipoyl-binding protein [Bacillota bacterium]
MRRFKVVVGGNEYDVEVEEYREEEATGEPVARKPVAVAGPATAPKPKVAQPRPSREGHAPNSKTITAPLGGTILKVNVKEGDRVKAGQIVLTLEALKLENEIAAPADGVVREIAVSPGNSVEIGQTLMVIDLD